jgi:hypothetical protein
MNKKAEVFIEGMLSVLAIAPAHATVRPNFIVPTEIQSKTVERGTVENAWKSVGMTMRSTFDSQVSVLPKSTQLLIK